MNPVFYNNQKEPVFDTQDNGYCKCLSDISLLPDSKCSGCGRYRLPSFGKAVRQVMRDHAEALEELADK